MIFQAPEVSELLNNIGVKFNEVKTSPLKGGPSLYAPMTEEQRAAVEVTVADAFDWFVEIVAERRGYTEEELVLVADGRVYSGRQAMDNRLIDALGGETDALAWLQEEKGLAETLQIRDTKTPDNFPFLNGVMAWATGDSNFADRLSLDGLLALWHP